MTAENNVWAFDFARRDGTGGFVRLERRPAEGVAWYWAYLVGPEIGLVVVRDHDVALPPPGDRLELRADGLWAELYCETPREHWSLGLEAFGVRLDDPADALGSRAEIGERLAVGFDLGWEVTEGTAHGWRAGRVVGELLVGRARIPFDAPGTYEAFRTSATWTRGTRRRGWKSDSRGFAARDDGPDEPGGWQPSLLVPLDGAVLARTLRRDPVGWWEELGPRP